MLFLTSTWHVTFYPEKLDKRKKYKLDTTEQIKDYIRNMTKKVGLQKLREMI